jgi:thiamine-phosphate pyrophosphorylase
MTPGVPAARPPLPPLYVVIDADVAARHGWAPVELTDAYLRGGARFLQVRAKQLASRPFLELAAAVVARAHEAGAVVVVNDRSDIARLSGADGVHLGQEDLGPGMSRTLVGFDAIVGLSTHTQEQVEAAVADVVNYVAMGPVFGTTTKSTGYEPIGLETIRRASTLAKDWSLPLVAIGGITLETAPEVIGAGATSVAVISDLLATGDPEARVRAYLDRLNETTVASN